MAELPLNDVQSNWLPISDISQSLENQGYIVLPNIIPEPVVNELIRAAESHAQSFRPAAIGRGGDEHKNTFVRRDKIAWLDPAEATLSGWFSAMWALRLGLNQRLFLGLWDFECHLAHYQRGDFYARHYDAFKGSSNRRVSLVAYLNKGWQPDQGGELVLYPQGFGGPTVKVTPQLGTVVLFLSEDMLHEVSPVARDRLSLAGWFRINDTTGQHIDPQH